MMTKERAQHGLFERVHGDARIGQGHLKSVVGLPWRRAGDRNDAPPLHVEKRGHDVVMIDALVDQRTGNRGRQIFRWLLEREAPSALERGPPRPVGAA